MDTIPHPYKMNILLISQCFFPESFRVNDFCKRLVEDGNEVTVITGYPNYPDGEIFEGYVQKKIFNENIFGADVLRVKIHPRHHGWFNRFINYTSFAAHAKKAVRNLNKKGFDIIFCWQTSPVSQIAPAIQAKKQFGVPLVVYCCDLWPESARAGNIKEKSLLFKAISLYSKKLYNSCDKIINVAPSFVDYQMKINSVPSSKLAYLLQFSDDLPEKTGFYRKEPDGKLDILFCGNIGAVQNIDKVIEAIHLANIPNLFFHVVGSGSQLDKCKNVARSLQIDSHVCFYGSVPHNQLFQFYKKCDACLLPLSAKTPIGLTIPSKFTEYLAAGKPIIGFLGGDAAELIKKEKLGICASPDDTKCLSDVLKQFARETDNYQIYGNNGRMFFLKYGTLDSWMSSFRSIVNEVKAHD
jgi:glycosyltransferase involved in cell wall biosynthesis